MKWYWKLFMFTGLLLAYLKTAEAMVQFSPKEFLGFSDPSLPYLWGYIAAAMVEGLAILAFENLIKFTKDTPTRTVSSILVVAAVLFSITMNLIDQSINDHTFTGGIGTPTGQLLYQTMGLIPIITAILLGVLRLVDAYYPDKSGFGGGGKQNQQPRTEHIPDFRAQGVTPNRQPIGESRDMSHDSQRQLQPERVSIPSQHQNGNGNGRIFGTDDVEMPKLIAADGKDPIAPQR